MKIETVEDLAQQMADWLGIYGSCKNVDETQNNCTYEECNPFCCRVGFLEAIEQRIRKSVQNDAIIEKLNL